MTVEAARSAAPDDIPVIATLAAEAIAEQGDERGGYIWQRLEARALPAAPDLLTSLDDEHRLVVVGTIDEVIIGYGAMSCQELRDGQLLASVTDLYVDPGARGIGVGEAMMDLLISQASEWGCVGVDTVVLPGNRDTKNFFETYGLVARSLTVHRRL